MNNIISAYVWAWKNYKNVDISLTKFRNFYPEAEIYINVDYAGDYENYKILSEKFNALLTKNSFQVGYCGNFGDLNVGYDCWSKEAAFEWVSSIYNACKKTNSKYLIILEEDDFILKPISLLDVDFSIAIHPTAPSPIGWYRANSIPNEFIRYIDSHNGNSISPGYGAGGGAIINTSDFIKSWEQHKEHIWQNYDYLRGINKIIGWADYLLQFIMQLGGCDVVQNNNLCEHWEVKDMWQQFEIVTGMKDIEIIKNL